MATGFAGYRRLLADRAALAFSLAGMPARAPMSMSGLGVVLLISITTGSFGRAGLVTGVATLTTAVTAPMWGRLTDRIGQARVLVATASIHTVSLGLLIITVQLELPLALTLVTAVGAGLGYPPAGAHVRARWAHRVRRGPDLDTAYAIEAVWDEVIFIVGPVLVTFLATKVHPALGVVTAVILGVGGALTLAAQRSTEPPVRPRRTDRTVDDPLPVRDLVPIMIGCAALGAMLGGMDVVIVAFAKESGILPWAGVLAMVWASGSLVAGVVTGAVTWRVVPATRFRVGAALLAVSALPLVFVSGPVLVGVFLLLSGLFIAPTLIAVTAATEAAVPSTRLTEALTWNSTGMAGGVALGAVLLGQVIDRWGAHGGFLGVLGFAVCLVLAALVLRGREPRPELVTTGG